MDNPLFVINFFISILSAAMVANWLYYKNRRRIAGAVLCHTMLNGSAVLLNVGQVAKCIATVPLFSGRGGHRRLRPFRLEEEPLLEATQERAEALRTAPRNPMLTFDEEMRAAAQARGETQAAIYEIRNRLVARERAVKDPTALIIIDEADRLKMAGLEQVRDIFDRGGIGLVLIGMPGIQKRLARYPQLYSCVGFVHEFRPLMASDVRRLLQQRWCPPGVALPADSLDDEESVSSIIRITGCTFRLLHRLLTQIDRVLELNGLAKVTREVVDAARESLVIGIA
jgi:hypothetical protein